MSFFIHVSSNLRKPENKKNFWIVILLVILNQLNPLQVSLNFISSMFCTQIDINGKSLKERLVTMAKYIEIAFSAKIFVTLAQ